MSSVQLFLGDCIEIIPTLPAGSVDAILTDLPYGTTACSWDTVIPFADLWRVVKHVLKPRGVFVTTASQPFTSALVMSNVDWFRYEWVWEKSLSGSPSLCNKAPLKLHENICVFSENGHSYNPIMTRSIRRKKGVHGISKEGHKFTQSLKHDGEVNDVYYPKSYVYFSNADRKSKHHPTQKPVALYEYLTLTYTNPGDTVLDLCAGSGTTGVACVKTGRNFIGIEKREDYFEIMERRIQQAQAQGVLPL